MLDLNFVRDNLPLVKEKLRQRGMDPAAVLKDFREVDVCRRQAITDAETTKARRNQASEEIAKLKKAGQDASAQMAETKQLREQIQEKEKVANELEVRLREILAGIPNISHESVPVGKGAEDNVEVLPPYMVNSDSMYGTGQLPKFAADSFRVPHGEKDLWLVPTAEVPLTNLYRDEVLEAARLPISLTAYTPCFRSEAGSYGKDVRGIIRQHQFQKVELVKVARPENSYEKLEKLTHDAEAVLQAIGLHYRVVTLSTVDV